MKYLILILFVFTVSCQQEDDMYCWECSTQTDTIVYLSTNRRIQVGYTLSVINTRTMCDFSEGYMERYENSGSEQTVRDDGKLAVVVTKTIKCHKQ